MALPACKSVLCAQHSTYSYFVSLASHGPTHDDNSIPFHSASHAEAHHHLAVAAAAASIYVIRLYVLLNIYDRRMHEMYTEHCAALQNEHARETEEEE